MNSLQEPLVQPTIEIPSQKNTPFNLFYLEMEAFRWQGKPSVFFKTSSIDTFVNEFWTPKQREGHSLQEISYRACFKPQLPRFFIDRLTKPGDTVYDPFMGRGTTVLEAALLGRVPIGCDVNPLSTMMVEPRLSPPTINEIAERLESIDFGSCDGHSKELRVFYHRKTLKQLLSLRKYLFDRETSGAMDKIDKWIRLVSINRLTGHSKGFFSVYTMPPNQAVSVEVQKRINNGRGQVPSFRDVPSLILKKSRALLRDFDADCRRTLSSVDGKYLLLSRSAGHTPEIKSGSISLIVTSPPFLDVINYASDNWLRCWFCGIDPNTVSLTMVKKLDDWKNEMTAVFRELRRVLSPKGHIAFEVGEVRNGKVRLEEAVVECGRAAGLEPMLILINQQKFTKTSNCWGVKNNAKGTNTNRIVILKKQKA